MTRDLQTIVYTFPDYCPWCEKSIISDNQNYHVYKDQNHDQCIDAVFLCPNQKCSRLFIASYTKNCPRDDKFRLCKITKQTFGNLPEFGKMIQEISPSFVDIYRESYIAEQQGLFEVCGCGYRKSLEFLLKDYLCREKPNQVEKIKKSPLGSLINNDISDPNIKACSKRAAWLGNDEAHYLKEWLSHDLTNLKDLIELTLNWIKSVEKTKKYIEELPE